MFNRNFGHNGLVFGLLCCLVFSAGTMAEDTQETPARLSQLQQRIERLHQEMQDNRSRHGQLQQELQQAEQDVGALANSLEQLEQKLGAKRHQLAQLEVRRQQQQQQLVAQKANLARQIRAAYLMGRQDYLKILLNQEAPDRVGRVLTYYDYFNRARVVQIGHINTTLEQIALLENESRLASVAIEQLLGEQGSRKADLEASNLKRQAVLDELTQAYGNQREQLQSLRDDKNRLQKLLRQVQGVLPAPVADAATPTQAFAQSKSQLSLPVAGKVLHRYGETRGSLGLKWQGLLISAPLGTPVQAIAAGRVVYADWFRNLGQLVIVEHEGGYMSLYGHNQSLYAKTGDWIEQGAALASVGNSGGQDEAGLYFELRRQGTPIDPRPWFEPG